MLYKDACNKKSNQKLGTIKSSNLCCEIVEYSDPEETAGLASIALSKFIIDTENPFSDVKIYTKDNCNWCVLLKALLKRKCITYEETHIASSQFEEFKKTHNVETIPLVYDGDRKIEDLQTHLIFLEINLIIKNYMKLQR